MAQESAENTRPQTNDIFILNSIHPEVVGIFGLALKPLDEIKDSAVIVLDTNVLLAPYRIGDEKLLDQYEKIYGKLIEEGRLVIPGQVAREYVKNRPLMLSNLYQQLSKKKGTRLWKGRYPLLSSMPEYQKVSDLEKQIDSLIQEYDKAVDKILDTVRSWRWNDPVSAIYSKLFVDAVVVDLPLDAGAQTTIKQDLNRRQTHRLPPGYKDAAKDDQGIGDLLIWHTIMNVGKTREQSVIFVSGDEKPDWYHQGDGRALYPRFELVEEFSRKSGGHSFHILKLSQFLELYGASEQAVQEVREDEESLARSARPTDTARQSWMLAHQAVVSWLERDPRNRSVVTLAGSRGPDILVERANGTLTGVEVVLEKQALVSPASVNLHLDNKIYKHMLGRLAGFMLVIVAEDESALMRRVGQFAGWEPDDPRITVVFGYIGATGEFVPSFQHTKE